MPRSPALVALAAGAWARARATRAHAPLALLLAIATSLVAVSQNEWTAAGSDAYAYVTQADLLRQGRLSVPAHIPDLTPWPNPLATLTPLGHGPAHGGTALAPITSPGFPLLMAGAAMVAGHCAQFLVTPLAAGVLIWMTFLIGRHAGGAGLGLGAAWLVATSPVLLLMARSVMSDVPAAAAWATAVAAALGAAAAGADDRRVRLACGTGLAASMAILIRPNLAPLAAVVGLWLLWHGDGERRWQTAGLFALAVVPGSLGVAWFQHTLYGSPFASGYGDLGALFSSTHIVVNLRQFGQWMIDTQTPLAAAGLAALVAPIGWLWPDRAAWRAAVLLALVTATVWLLYLPYTPFDAWWFLRFLLPAWPALAIGMAALLLHGLGRAGRLGSAVATLAIFAVGIVTAGRAPGLGVYLPGEGERRYVSIAEHVARLTEPHAVIISGQHSGSIRYYAGRDTLRFEVLDEAWLDRAVAWLDAQGRPAYFLLEDWELARFEARFGEQNTHGRLAAPVLAFRAHRIPGLAYLFDPRHPSGPTAQPAPVVDPRPRCAPPAASPRLAAWTP